MKSLQQYLLDQKTIDHAMRAMVHDSGVVTITIHPQGVDGDTVDFVVAGNQLIPQQHDGHILSPELAVDRYLNEREKQG